MIIYGKEIDFKISNVKHAAAMKLALDEMSETEKKVKAEAENGNLESTLTAMIDMFQKFFQTATGNDVLCDCEDMQEARDAYEAFLSEINTQKKAMLAPYSVNRIK